MKRCIWGFSLIFFAVAAKAQTYSEVWVESYINGIRAISGGNDSNIIFSKQPIILSADIYNIGPNDINPYDTLWFRYYLDSRWYRTNGKLYQNYPIYEKAVTTSIRTGTKTRIILDTLLIADSLFKPEALFKNWHKIGIQLYRSAVNLAVFDDGYYMFRFLTDPTASSSNIQSKEPKIIATYDFLGRPVKNIKSNVPYIFLFDNGQKKKLIQHD